jgi:hypothetical protein
MSIPPANSLLGHPVLFQRPEWDKALIANPQLRESTDPNHMWYRSPSQNTQDSQLEALKSNYTPLRVTTLREMPTLLYNAYFSKQNMVYIQKALQLQVKQVSGYSVPMQDPDALLIIMVNAYKEHARHVNEDTAPIMVVVQETRKEIQRLNAIVLAVVVPTVIINVESLKRTSERIENPAKELPPMPVSTSLKGTIQYRPVDDINKLS